MKSVVGQDVDRQLERNAKGLEKEGTWTERATDRVECRGTVVVAWATELDMASNLA